METEAPDIPLTLEELLDRAGVEALLVDWPQVRRQVRSARCSLRQLEPAPV
jgi:hypothetical protein